MYRKYFGLTQKPFEVSPDPDFLYFTGQHREMLASLIYGIHERRGFMAVIGEVGTGKTTILNALLDRLGASHRCAFFFYTGNSFEVFLNQVLVELKLLSHDDHLSVREAIRRLNHFAREQYQKGGNVVLIIDEAQNLDRNLLEQIRLLSNLETRKHKLIQIVLSGQVELDDLLNRYDLRQLTQRINLKRYVTALDYQDTLAYIQHRLDLAGYRGEALFSTQALRLIRMHSAGIPRKINVLCDNALVTAYGLDQKKVDAAIIREAIHDLRSGLKLNRVLKTRMLRLLRKMRTMLMSSWSPKDVKVTGSQEKNRFSAGRRLSSMHVVLIALVLVIAAWPIFHQDSSASLESASIGLADEGKNKAVALFPSPHTDGLSGAIPQRFRIEGDGRQSGTSVSDQIHQDTNNKQPIVTDTRLVASTVTPDRPYRPTFMIAKKGDSLSSIIRRHYGFFGENILMEIIKANQAIANVNLINVGQVINLPEMQPSMIPALHNQPGIK